jgi:hypothetical protein
VRPRSATNKFLAVFFRDYDPKIQVADAYWWQQITVNEQAGMLRFPHNERAVVASFGRGLVQAVGAARSARFEHGAGRQAITGAGKLAAAAHFTGTTWL